MLIKQIQGLVLVPISEIIGKELNHLIDLSVDRFPFSELFAVNQFNNFLVNDIVGKIKVLFHNFL